MVSQEKGITCNKWKCLYLCIAISCPTLYAPDNGTIVCTGDQVTGETCSFECDPGFYLVGSQARLCLTNSTWTGEDAYCPPLLCGTLETDLINQLAQPCYDYFPSVCSHVCANGYYVAGTGTGHYERACEVDIPNINVEWSPPKTCSGKFRVLAMNTGCYVCIII